MRLKSGTFRGYKMNFKFNASHNFSKKESGKHAHTFCVDLFIKKNSDQFVEFNKYEVKIRKYFLKYQKQYLNDMVEFSECVPTLEAMVSRFFADIDSIFNETNEYSLVRVELGDNPISSVSVGNDIVVSSSNLFVPRDSFIKYKEIVVRLNRNKKVIV